ncbi:histidine kinase,HAMP domain-containing protein,histidine kinase [Beggiatoa alba B18LD]|uniref:histidine kinase n=1 Tax=Beggiatoa alba B18LD TaxID=395493 RepID=I3CKJ9_9GAMM|nr:ATP-binding protein [Beggiatoa alba]EIJ44142.1 histidine kinase,HAMP domain-containing protein,histidine kinase [Beggiatoa alba B18LD]
MKFGLLAKFFLALLFSSTLVAIAMAISAHWSFRAGFMEYLQNVDAEKLAKVRLALENEYAIKKNWSFLSPKKWHEFLDKQLGEEFHPLQPNEMFPHPKPPDDRFMRDDNPFFERGAPPPLMRAPPPNQNAERHEPRDPNNAPLPNFPREPPPHEGREKFLPKLLPLSLRPRLRLLSADKKFIVGTPIIYSSEELKANKMREISVPINDRAQRTIGWLVLGQGELETDELATSFLKQQTQTYYLIAALVVLITTLTSLFLARQLLIPVQRITTAARHLSAGQYQTRVMVNSRDELGQLANDFNLLAYTLERNETARRQWIADISHELRTPLAILRGEVEAIQDGIRQFNMDTLKSLHVEVLGLGKLVDDLYELALSDIGALDYRREKIDILALIEDIFSIFQIRLQQHQLQLQNQTELTSPVYCQLDARRFMQLLHNLLENSLRYTDAGGKVVISTALSSTQETIIITLEDTPPSVPTEALPNLFERLYRVDKSRSRALGGAGLGLAICKNIVEAHNGTIQAFHASLGGLGIRIELPLLKQS